MKISMNMSDELVYKIDDYAKKHYSNRSSVISVACNKFLNEELLYSSIKDISIVIRKIADSNSIDEESKRKLDEFNNFIKYFN